MFKISDLEKLIDQCNDVLDGEAESIIFQNERYLNGFVDWYFVHVSDEKSVKNIRAMAYALRNALTHAEERNAEAKNK